jgi:hypothetical protein
MSPSPPAPDHRRRIAFVGCASTSSLVRVGVRGRVPEPLRIRCPFCGEVHVSPVPLGRPRNRGEHVDAEPLRREPKSKPNDDLPERILATLADGERKPSDLAAEFGVEARTVKRKVAKLNAADPEPIIVRRSSTGQILGLRLRGPDDG